MRNSLSVVVGEGKYAITTRILDASKWTYGLASLQSSEHSLLCAGKNSTDRLNMKLAMAFVVFM